MLSPWHILGQLPAPVSRQIVKYGSKRCIGNATKTDVALAMGAAV